MKLVEYTEKKKTTAGWFNNSYIRNIYFVILTSSNLCMMSWKE